MFERGPKNSTDKVVALTFDADMTAAEGRARRRGSISTIPN